jgi:hypothetical protein
MVIEMAIDHEAILRRAYENLARADETLAEPRAELTWQPPEPNRYRSYAVETLDEILKASEARMDKRIKELEGRVMKGFSDIHEAFDAVAEIGGTALGEAERRLCDEYRRELESLRNEVTLLRAQANTPARRQKPTVSRAPLQPE